MRPYLELELRNSKTRIAELERQLLEAGLTPRPMGSQPPVAISETEFVQLSLFVGKVIW